jgi:hypothetical protein
MKVHGMKWIWAGGLVLVLSAAGFNRLSNSLDKSAAQPQLATLASLYKSSDPYVLSSARTETAVGQTAGFVEQTVDAMRQNPGKTDFSPYVLLHVTRADNLATRDGID